VCVCVRESVCVCLCVLCVFLFVCACLRGSLCVREHDIQIGFTVSGLGFLIFRV
jgi:hypothetical protein